MLKKCSYCGNTEPDFIKVCTRCGKELDIPNKEKTDESYRNNSINPEINQENATSNQDNHINDEEYNQQETFSMNKIHMAIGIIIIVILLVLAISFTQQSGEEDLFESKISQVLSNEENMTYIMENSGLESLDISNVNEINNMKNIIENSSNKLSEDIKILDELNESLSDNSKKGYIGLHKKYVQDTKDMYDTLDKLLNTTQDYNSGKISQTETQQEFQNTLQHLRDKKQEVNRDTQEIQNYLAEHPDIKIRKN